MRVDFVKAVERVMRTDEKSVFLTGDLGYAALEPIAEACGKRFVNAGVAEQNMVGMSAGIALSGYTPWVYSIAPFIVYRCVEQIRNDVCLHNLPVRLVGNGGGYTYGVMGSTHHALEDLAVLKSLPNLRLYFPNTNDHVAAAVDQMHAHQGPAYLRLAICAHTAKLSPLSENPVTLTRQYAKGSRLTLIGVGHAVQVALAAMATLDLGSVGADIFGVARYPFDLASDGGLVDSVRRTGKVLVIEEHYLPGSMAESLKMELPNTSVFKVMCPRYFTGQRYGSAAFHLAQAGLTPQDLTHEAKRIAELDQA
jgi:transketolase